MPTYVDPVCKPDALLADATDHAVTALDEGADEVVAFQESASEVFHTHTTAHDFGLPEYVFLVESLLAEPGTRPCFSAHAHEDAGDDVHALFAELARCALRDALPIALNHDVEVVVQVDRPTPRNGRFDADGYLQTLTDATVRRVGTRTCGTPVTRRDDEVASTVREIIHSVRPSWEHLPTVEQALLIETAAEAAGDSRPVPSEQLSTVDGPTPPAFDEIVANFLWFSIASALTDVAIHALASSDPPDRQSR